MADTTSPIGADATPQTRQAEARLVLDRAHAAARDADGAGLRRALEEASGLLRGLMPQMEERLARALRDLDSGALVEMESLIEEARRELPPA